VRNMVARGAADLTQAQFFRHAWVVAAAPAGLVNASDDAVVEAFVRALLCYCGLSMERPARRIADVNRAGTPFLCGVLGLLDLAIGPNQSAVRWIEGAIVRLPVDSAATPATLDVDELARLLASPTARTIVCGTAPAGTCRARARAAVSDAATYAQRAECPSCPFARPWLSPAGRHPMSHSLALGCMKVPRRARHHDRSFTRTAPTSTAQCVVCRPLLALAATTTVRIVTTLVSRRGGRWAPRHYYTTDVPPKRARTGPLSPPDGGYMLCFRTCHLTLVRLHRKKSRGCTS
jgi:hypothetical protein